MTPPDLWLVRHATTEWSATGRHTSYSDIPLTEAGRAAASRLEPALASQSFAHVYTSPASRSRETATLAGFAHAEVEPDLREWDYGELEGLTTEQIRARGADWDAWTIWRGPVPGGERGDDVQARARQLVGRLDATPGPVLLFGHGHLLRVLTAVALGFGFAAGQHFALDPGTIGILGHEHEARALRAWNRTP